MPETDRLLIGMVAGFKSERWPVNDWNGGRLQSGIRIMVQNNGYAISVPARKQFRARAVADKAIGYGMRGVEVDGNDFIATYRALRDAVRIGHVGGGPTLIEAQTYRMAPHTNSDDPSIYRDLAEQREWQEKDPILRLKSALEAMGLLDDVMDEAIAREAAIRAGEMRKGVMVTPAPDTSRLFANVYATLPPHIERQKNELLTRETTL